MNARESAPSPEVTKRYRCPVCGNTERFIGIDDHGYPGEDCDCDQDPCVCEVTLRQPFTVTDGQEHYAAFEGGGFGAEIGSYTRVECADCGAEIWREESDSRSDQR